MPKKARHRWRGFGGLADGGRDPKRAARAKHTSSAPMTPGQARYLADLWERTGQPRLASLTITQASAEIARLQQLSARPKPRAETAAERRRRIAAEQLATQPPRRSSQTPPAG